jgi:hypothetical protein
MPGKMPGETEPRVTPARAEPVVSGPGDPERLEHPEPWRAGFQSPAREDEWVRSLAPSREGQTAPQLPVLDARGQQADLPGVSQPARPYQSPQSPVTVSYLLKQLELVRDDTEQFNSTLRRIQDAGQSDDPNDRAKSWEVISSKYWYDNIARHRNFHIVELAGIFGIIVIPELAEPAAADAADAIVQWACAAPPPMIGGLLAAAKMASPEMWQAVMRLLEPVLAARWTADYLPPELWDADRVMRSAELARGEGKRGVRNPFRRR